MSVGGGGENDEPGIGVLWWDLCKAIMKRANLNQKGLATKLGLDAAIVTHWKEKGENPTHAHEGPTLAQVGKLYKVFPPATSDEAKLLKRASVWVLERTGWTREHLRDLTDDHRLRELEREIAMRQTEGAWFTILFDHVIGTDLLPLFRSSRVSDIQARNACWSLLNQACDFYAKTTGHSADDFRGSVYRPDRHRKYLTIFAPVRIGPLSVQQNHWYIGDPPVPAGEHRGIPGTVFYTGENRFEPDIWKAGDFWDPHVPPRDEGNFPYISLVQAVIWSSQKEKLGVLSLDSRTYRFGEHDLSLMKVLAQCAGWVLARA